ncbi:MAG: hypothetical protein GEU91_13580 [Rhizobiales bacterium]|nr:hypothetical protein [Hyphomicrobiales bacterium]
MTTRTTIARAVEGYDAGFYQTLCHEIAEAIGQASIVVDAPLMAIRTGETADALVSCLISVIALSPEARKPTQLRRLTESIAKQIRTGVTAAKDEPAITQLLARKPTDARTQ